jgi:hypothetical protein
MVGSRTGNHVQEALVAVAVGRFSNNLGFNVGVGQTQVRRRAQQLPARIDTKRPPKIVVCLHKRKILGRDNAADGLAAKRARSARACQSPLP